MARKTSYQQYKETEQYQKAIIAFKTDGNLEMLLIEVFYSGARLGIEAMTPK